VSVAPPKALLTRIRSEYMEMPGLQLTLSQAQRLCGVERGDCEVVFETLVHERFLSVKPDGSYVRSDGSDRSRSSRPLPPL
jgi:hypothetical protein